MSETHDGGPAFPRPHSEEEFMDSVETHDAYRGMSLRDWFAGQALNTLINKCEDRDGGWDVHAVAAGAYALADAMIEARKGEDK